MAKTVAAGQHKPKHIISRRNTRPHPLEPRDDKPHRTLDDWDRQERYERCIVKLHDDISDWVGVKLHYENYSNLLWRDDHRKDPEVVSRFYPHEQLIVDLPDTQEDTLRRIDLFERLGIKYMYVDAQEEMDEKQFKARLKRVRENHEKTNRMLAGHGVRRAG